jgi:D-glycero-alpha-D-manno-heptose 1-phosphate guanylyltransferase|tara:strand:+ start:730 stop:1440 length:711 start_codon:yes stop_codon:yes gene_type:complete
LQAIILAGGRGTRLKQVVPDVPKPMAEINGTPFLALLISYLSQQEITRIILSVGHQYQKIVDYFGDSYQGVEIAYTIEEQPLGTGGAIKLALETTESVDPVFVLNGDTFCQLNFKEMYGNFHDSGKTFGIALTEVENSSRFGSVQLSSDRSGINNFTEKRHSSGSGLINSGVYLLYKNFFEQFNFGEKFSFENDCLYPHVSRIDCFPYVYDGKFIDIGIPEDFEKAQHFLSFIQIR